MFLYTARVLRQIALGFIRPVEVTHSVKAPAKFSVPFRCWPIDMDLFMHMNNSNYLRVAELARWRVFPGSGSLQMVKDKTLFLAVENYVKYLRPIGPLAKFVVETTIEGKDDKWMYYTHRFIQDPTTVKAGKEAHLYCEVICKAVLKEQSGRTIKLSEVKHPFYTEMVKFQAEKDSLAALEASKV